MEQKSLYVCPDTKSSGGDGTEASPLRVGTEFAQTLTLDELIGRMRLGPPITLRLADGIYETAGLWNFKYSGNDYATFPEPVSIIGDGMENTIIRLSERAITKANEVERPDLCVMRFGIPWRNNGGPYLVRDLTVDGNCRAFPASKLITGGLIFHSNNVTCKRVKFRGFRGSHTLAHEAFPLLANNFMFGSYLGPDGNNHFIDCVVESQGDEEEPYMSPIYNGVRQLDRPLALSTIVGCRVFGKGKRPIRIGVSPGACTLIDRFSADHVQHAIYNDTGSLRDVIVRDSNFTRVTYSGPWFIVETVKERILINRCTFDYTPDKGKPWIGLVIWDSHNTEHLASDVTLRECIFRGPQVNLPDVLPFTPTSIHKARLANIKMGGNTSPVPFPADIP